MPNLINEIMSTQLEGKLKSMGSCIVLSFDKLTVAQANEIRNQLREDGVQYLVVKNRLAIRSFNSLGLDLESAFTGKCGVVLAEEEGAISAARIIRDFALKERRATRAKAPPMLVTGGVIEGEVITGPAAARIADMPDKLTVRGMLASAISGPARSLAGCIQGLPAGLARVIKGRVDQDADAPQP